MSTTTSYKKIALAGGTGSLGSPVLAALIAANFSITLLTRDGSTSKPYIPQGADVTIKPVDYTSSASLKAALAGNDALVITVTSSAISSQITLIDAAIDAGVKRIIPSEFGSDTYNPNSRKLPVYGDKVAVQEHLAEKAAQNPDVSYTVLMNNAFYDWGPALAGFLVDIPGRKAELYDGGDRPFSITRLGSVAKAIVGILQHPEETKNKAMYIHEAVVTQNQLISIAEKAGSGKFDTKVVDLAQLEQASYEGLGKDGANIMGIMYAFLKSGIFREGYGGKFEHVDNEILGVDMMSLEEIEAVVKKLVR